MMHSVENQTSCTEMSVIFVGLYVRACVRACVCGCPCQSQRSRVKFLSIKFSKHVLCMKLGRTNDQSE